MISIIITNLSFCAFKTKHLNDQLSVHLLAYLVRALHQCHKGHRFESHSQSLDILQAFLLQNCLLYAYSGDKVCFSADSNPISLRYSICQSWTKWMRNLYPPPQKSRMGKWRVLSVAWLHPCFRGMGINFHVPFCRCAQGLSSIYPHKQMVSYSKHR